MIRSTETGRLRTPMTTLKSRYHRYVKTTFGVSVQALCQHVAEKDDIAAMRTMLDILAVAKEDQQVSERSRYPRRVKA